MQQSLPWLVRNPLLKMVGLRAAPSALLWTLLLLLPSRTVFVDAFPEQGKWSGVLNESDMDSYFGVYKSLYKGSQVFISIQCDSKDVNTTVKINWYLRETPCWEEYGSLDLLTDSEKKFSWRTYYLSPEYRPVEWEYLNEFQFRPPDVYEHRCDNSINLVDWSQNISSNDTSQKSSTVLDSKVTRRTIVDNEESQQKAFKSQHPVFAVPKDGVYLLIVHMESVDQKSFSATVRVQMKGDHGYLSATEWPLLLFYGGCCILYVLYGLVWLILSFCQWRDLLRIQFWIGGVIFLGMIEMAVFYAEYQSINSTGESVTGAVLVAEIISCAKRTLARLLVIIVSIGFGIVKPRLGSTLHQIILVGSLYFGLASTEACLRVLHPVNGPSNRALMAGIPLSILDAGICYSIFMSLMTTMRTLRLRRNLVKLNLYRHFTNTLVFCLIASVGFMIWSIRFLKTAQCLRDWKEIWLDEAYWHMLFSVILLVIMILWRPSQNNQRYSFSPLLDNFDDDDEEDLVVNAAFSGNMKLRQKKNGTEKIGNRNQSIEEELRWVEENIPADMAEGDLPALDSEEELLSTKFELSKMQ